MTETAEPKFSIWLGDDWPGPYIVTYTTKKGRDRISVVNGVQSPGEALCVADAEHHIPEEEIDHVTVMIGHVAEASHHLPALADFRQKSEAMRVEMEAKRAEK